MVRNLQNIFMEHDLYLISQWFWHKIKMYNFDPNNVIMAIATNIPQRHKTGFVVQGHICVFVFCGECGCICMLSICVADNQLWLLWLNDGYHHECWSAIMILWPISAWLSSVLPHISVWLLIIINNLCECLAISVYRLVRLHAPPQSSAAAWQKQCILVRTFVLFWSSL